MSLSARLHGALLLLFQGGSVTCFAAVDGNGDGFLDVSDVVYQLDWLFAGGLAPPAPFPDCGSVPTPLSCDSYPPCP